MAKLVTLVLWHKRVEARDARGTRAHEPVSVFGRSALHMNRIALAVLLAAVMVASVGCASKKYVRQETTPLINKTNELDDQTAKNSKDIKGSQN